MMNFTNSGSYLKLMAYNSISAIIGNVDFDSLNHHERRYENIVRHTINPSSCRIHHRQIITGASPYNKIKRPPRFDLPTNNKQTRNARTIKTLLSVSFQAGLTSSRKEQKCTRTRLRTDLTLSNLSYSEDFSSPEIKTTFSSNQLTVYFTTIYAYQAPTMYILTSFSVIFSMSPT